MILNKMTEQTQTAWKKEIEERLFLLSRETKKSYATHPGHELNSGHIPKYYRQYCEAIDLFYRENIENIENFKFISAFSFEKNKKLDAITKKVISSKVGRFILSEIHKYNKQTIEILDSKKMHIISIRKQIRVIT